MGGGGGGQDLLVDDGPGRQDALVTVQTWQLEVEGVERNGEAETDKLEEQGPHPRHGPATEHFLSAEI